MMHPAAALAIKAAHGYRDWGPYMARAFIRKRGVDMRLVRLARQLQAAT